MDKRSKAELDLIAALEQDQEVSQTGLAKRLGIAAGLVNILMKRAVKRGFVKMTQIPARRYAYYLTPTGFAEKAKLVAGYLDSSLSLYRRLRVDYRDMFTALEAKGVTRVTLVGDIDIAELAIMASFDSAITITALVSTDTNKGSIGPVPVVSSLEGHSGEVVIICDARSPQACFDEIADVMDHDKILFPDAFYIKNTPFTSDNEAA
ncbi:MAG: winged helix-turn-helix transcriptional regulator [Alphaproteobacteria bacterium]|nr:winged helix-turn-helix transcriptional regulator [Alphaproteobacteria bacterium]